MSEQACQKCFKEGEGPSGWPLCYECATWVQRLFGSSLSAPDGKAFEEAKKWHSLLINHAMQLFEVNGFYEPV